MICFDLGEELQLIHATALRFATERLRPHGRPAERAQEMPPELAAEFAELGLGLIELPEALGGTAMGLTAAVVVQEALAYGDAGLAMVLPQPGAFARLLTTVATPEQQEVWLRPLVDEPLAHRGALGLSDSAGGCKAIRQGDGYLLRGNKPFVLHAGLADRYAVLAQLDDRQDFAGAGLFVFEAHASGVRVGPRQTTVGLEVIHGATLSLDDVRVAVDQRLGQGDLTALMDKFFATTGLIQAASAVGVAQASYDYALRYAQQRQAFGKPVAHFQSIAFLLSDMLMQCEAARWSVRYAAWAYDHQQPGAIGLLYQARAQADEAAAFVTDNAVQVLGGHGYIQDHPVEKWMRDSKALALTYGSREAADCRAAAALLELPCTADLLPVGSIQPVWT